MIVHLLSKGHPTLLDEISKGHPTLLDEYVFPVILNKYFNLPPPLLPPSVVCYWHISGVFVPANFTKSIPEYFDNFSFFLINGVIWSFIFSASSASLKKRIILNSYYFNKNISQTIILSWEKFVLLFPWLCVSSASCVDHIKVCIIIIIILHNFFRHHIGFYSFHAFTEFPLPDSLTIADCNFHCPHILWQTFTSSSCWSLFFGFLQVMNGGYCLLIGWPVIDFHEFLCGSLFLLVINGRCCLPIGWLSWAPWLAE